MKNLIKRSLFLVAVIVASNLFGKDVRTKAKVYMELSCAMELDSVFTNPIVKRNGDRIYVSKVTTNKESFVITMYDEDFKVLYKEEIIGNNHLIKTLNISLLPKGNYRLNIVSGERSFTHTIIIE